LNSGTLYKKAFNQALDVMSSVRIGGTVPSETELSSHIVVDASTVREIFRDLEGRGIIGGVGGSRVIYRAPTLHDVFPEYETISAAGLAQRRLMQWMVAGDIAPGAVIDPLNLSRELDVSTIGIREFLHIFSGTGLVEQHENGTSTYRGFDDRFFSELFEVREEFELRAALSFIRLSIDSPLWSQMRMIRQQHQEILDNFENRFKDFFKIDGAFHRLIRAPSFNPFIENFYSIIPLLLKYQHMGTDA
jgi:DNA-binding GntR family transcriptional regulator